MRSVRRRLTYANVISSLCLFLILAGGAAYAGDTVFSSDIVDGQVKTVDIGNNQVQSVDVRDDTVAGGGLSGSDLQVNSVGATEVASNAIDSDEIADGTLSGADVGQLQVVNFTGTTGVVNGSACVYRKVTGLPLDNKDHLVLTPDVTTAKLGLTYTAEFDGSETGDMWIQVCNHTSSPIDDGTTKFNLLMIDAD